MATITITRFKRRKAAKSNVVEKAVVTPSGQSVSIRSIPADSPTFKDDFLRVFSANVKAALKGRKKQVSRKSRAAAAS